MSRSAIVLTLTAVLCLALCTMSPAEQPSPPDEAQTLLETAAGFHKRANSADDLLQAVDTYERSLAKLHESGDIEALGRRLHALAAALTGLGRYPEALHYFEQALQTSEIMGRPKAQAIVLADMATVFNETGDYRRCLEYCRKSITIRETLSDFPAIAATYNLLGIAHQNRGEHGKALAAFQMALTIVTGAHDRRLEADICISLGNAYFVSGSYSDAERTYQMALAIHKERGDSAGQASVMNNLGVLDTELGRFAKAEESCLSALNAARASGNLNLEARTLHNLGLLRKARGDLAAAIEAYGTALELREKLKDVKGQAETLNNLANAYRDSGAYDASVIYGERCLSLVQGIGHPKLRCAVLDSLGELYAFWGQYSRALERFQEGLELARRLGIPKSEAVLLTHIGALMAQQGEHREALSKLHEARAILERIGASPQEPEGLIAGLYLDLGKPDQAEPFARKIGSQALLGRLSLVRKDNRAAAKHYELLLKGAEETGNVDDLLTACTGLGRTLEATGEFRKSAEFYERAMELTEELRSSLLPAERRNFFEVKIGGFGRADPARGLVSVRFKQGLCEEAISPSESIRARAFADRISQGPGAGRAVVPKSVLKKEEDLLTRIAALKKLRLRIRKDRNPTYHRDLTVAIESAETDHKELIEKLWRDYRRYAAVKYPRPVGLQNSAVRATEHVVVFDVLSDGVGVKLIKGKTLVTGEFVPWEQHDLEAYVRKYREPMERVALSDYDPEAARKLYHRLLAPVLTNIPAGTPITVIPDGVLALIPFEALVVQGTTQWEFAPWGTTPVGLTYLGDLHPVSYYQSLTALTLQRTLRKSTPPAKRLLVIADPVFDLDDERVGASKGEIQGAEPTGSELNLMEMVRKESCAGLRFPRLPMTGRLAERLARVYGSETKICSGFQASRGVFFQEVAPHLDRYSHVVIATHGVFSAAVPGIHEPALTMTMVPAGADGFLRMSDVAGLDMRADIVALVGCQTALGRYVSGEGLMTMGRAFQYAGARCVLITLWSVDEAASVRLVERFFTHLYHGKDKREALALARLELRASGQDHPFFWGAFVLAGEAD